MMCIRVSGQWKRGCSRPSSPRISVQQGYQDEDSLRGAFLRPYKKGVFKSVNCHAQRGAGLKLAVWQRQHSAWEFRGSNRKKWAEGDLMCSLVHLVTGLINGSTKHCNASSFLQCHDSINPTCCNAAQHSWYMVGH